MKNYFVIVGILFLCMSGYFFYFGMKAFMTSQPADTNWILSLICSSTSAISFGLAMLPEYIEKLVSKASIIKSN